MNSPQYEEHYPTIKFPFLKCFQKPTAPKTYYFRPFFGQPQQLLTLDVTVPHTINTHKFCPSIISGSKLKIPSQSFVDNI